MKRLMLVVMVALTVLGLTSCATFKDLMATDSTPNAYAANYQPRTSFGRQLFATILAGVLLQYQNENWVLQFNGQVAASNLTYYDGRYPYVAGNYYGAYDFMVPPAFQGWRLRPVYVFTPNDFDKGVNFYTKDGALVWRVVVGPGPYNGRVVLLPVQDGEFTFNWDKGGGRIPLRVTNSGSAPAPNGLLVADVIKAESSVQPLWRPYGTLVR